MLIEIDYDDITKLPKEEKLIKTYHANIIYLDYNQIIDLVQKILLKFVILLIIAKLD